MSSKIFSAMLLILLLIGCKDESTAPVDLTFEIQPLNTGNTYYYVDSTIMNENWHFDSTVITVSGQTTLTGEPNSQAVAMWDVYTNGNFIRRNLLDLDEDALYHYAEINNDDTLMLRKPWVIYPVNVGDQFLEPRYKYIPSTGEYQPEGTWKWHCVSVDSQITIKNGQTIFCHIFRAAPDSRTEVFLIYSLNIGYTGWQTNYDGEKIYRQILTDYELK